MTPIQKADLPQGTLDMLILKIVALGPGEAANCERSTVQHFSAHWRSISSQRGVLPADRLLSSLSSFSYWR